MSLFSFEIIEVILRHFLCKESKHYSLIFSNHFLWSKSKRKGINFFLFNAAKKVLLLMNFFYQETTVWFVWFTKVLSFRKLCLLHSHHQNIIKTYKYGWIKRFFVGIIFHFQKIFFTIVLQKKKESNFSSHLSPIISRTVHTQKT